MNKSKYIYLSDKPFDGTVFQTQVLDWLHLYKEHGIDFELFEGFHIRQALSGSFVKSQKKRIGEKADVKVSFFTYFPSRGLFVWLNVLILWMKLRPFLKGKQEVVVFGRANFGIEIEKLISLSGNRIKYVCDLRAAGSEEILYLIKRSGEFTKRKFGNFVQISLISYVQQKIATRIFTVSNVLKSYFIDNYNADPSKFVYYPCLSSSKKFFYDPKLRGEVRAELKIADDEKLFLYAGGVAALWHISDVTLDVFNKIAQDCPNSKFLFLTRDKFDLSQPKYPYLDGKIITFSAQNEDMVKYLNAADYGILIRDNTPMNNVASPSKFAEYMLCGLPTIISGHIGDYTQYCVDNGCGYVVSDEVMGDIERKFAVQDLLSMEFDRQAIAKAGKANLSKEANIDRLIKVFEQI